MNAEHLAGAADATDRMTVSEIVSLLSRRRRTVAAVAGGVLAAAVIVTLLSPVKFRIQGSLYLGDLQPTGTPQASLPEQLDLLGERNGDVGTEIEILKSRTLLERAILGSGLNVVLTPAGWSPPRYWQWRLRRRDPRLLEVGRRHVLATNAVLAEPRYGASEYTVRFGANGRYEIANAEHVLGAGTLGLPFSGGGLAVTLLAGPEGPPPAAATFKLEVTPAGEVADDIDKELTITTPKTATPGETLKVVSLEYKNASPRVAVAFVGDLMRAYVENRQGWKTEEATAAERFVSEQSRSIKSELDEAERGLAEFKSHSKVVALGDESRGLIDQLGKYEEQRVAARLQAATFDQIEDVLAKPDAPVERYMVGETEDPVLATLSNNLALARQELRHVEARYTPEAPETIEQRAQVETQRKMVKDYVVGRAARAQNQLSSLNQMIGQFEGRLKTVPAAELDLARLTRNAEVLGKMYSFLLERQQEAAVSKASTMSRTRVLDAPALPYREDSPSLLLRLVLGAFMGLFLGVAAVVLRGALSPNLESDKQIMSLLGDVPVLAAIPHNAVGARKRARDGGAALVASPGYAEALRLLRTALYGGGVAGSEVVLVTSPCPGDGKTLCTVSLAAALVADGKRVLVIEADLHKPSLTGLLAISPRGGLVDVLLGREPWDALVVDVPAGSGSFDLIPAQAGASNSAEMLSGPRFAEALRQMRAAYDFVLIDSPPFPLISDALILSRQVDRVLSVLRLGNTERRAAERHLRGLGAGSTRHAVVVNNADGDSYPAALAYYHGHARGARRGFRPAPSKVGRARAPAAPTTAVR